MSVAGLSSRVEIRTVPGKGRGLFLRRHGVQQGEEIFRVKLESGMFSCGQEWSVSMAKQLLVEKRRGEASKWRDYLQSLPDSATGWTTMAWEQIQQVEYAPGLRQIDELYHWSSHQYQIHNVEEYADKEEWDWAIGVVHSRTFRPKGGRGERYLLPIVDMMNHAGDQSRKKGDVVAMDNVEWAIKGDEVVLSAVNPIGEGEELLLSYAETSNDYFFLFHGFVPQYNPHDNFELWRDSLDLLSWIQKTPEAQDLRFGDWIPPDFDDFSIYRYGRIDPASLDVLGASLITIRCQEVLGSFAHSPSDDLSILLANDTNNEYLLEFIDEYQLAPKAFCWMNGAANIQPISFRLHKKLILMDWINSH